MWESAVVPYADNVEVTGSHVGLVFNRKAYRAIADALAKPELVVRVHARRVEESVMSFATVPLRAPRRGARHRLLLRARAVHRRAVGALHRVRAGSSTRRSCRRSTTTGSGPSSRGRWSRRLGRARHRRRGHRGLRLPRDEPARVRPGAHGAAPRRRQPRHVPRRAGRTGDEVDRDARLRGAEAALAAADGAAREDRRVRAHRAAITARTRWRSRRRPGATATTG